MFIADKFIVDFGTSTVEMYYPYPAWSSDNRNIIFFTHENGSFYEYGSFYAVDTKTGKATIISGKHAVEDGAISPIATTP